MGSANAHPERIERMKTKRLQLDWSYQDIVDKVLDAGDITSISTVKRVFASGSESRNFKEATLQPIEKALGLLEENKSTQTSPNQQDLYAVIMEQHQQLKDVLKTSRMKDVSIFYLLGLISIYLIVDKAIPTVGWYRGDFSVGWVLKAVAIGAFVVVSVVYLFIKRRKQNSKGGTDEM